MAESAATLLNRLVGSNAAGGAEMGLGTVAGAAFGVDSTPMFAFESKLFRADMLA